MNAPRLRLAPLLRSARLPAALWLLIGGAALVAVYALAFTARYSLAEHARKPMQSVATLNFLSLSGAVIYAAAFAGAFALYGLAGWFGARRAGTWRAGAVVVGLAALMNAVLLPMYPTDAADLYDYIIRGRMAAYYDLNPLRDVPRPLQNDPFYDFVGWKDVPSAYGPAWEALAALTARAAGDDNIANVVAFKLLSVVGYALTALFIGLTLRQIAPRLALIGVFLFAWNPLVVYMVGGRGHNDALMTACIAFGVWCAARRAYVPATLGMVVGALLKFIPAALIPLIAVLAWRELSARGRLRYVALSAVGGLALCAVFYAPYWHGLDTLRAERRGDMYTGSVATVVRQLLAPTLDGKSGETWLQATPNVNRLLSLTTLVGMAAFYVWRVWATYHDRRPTALARNAALVLTFYLLVAALWFQSWYVLWTLALVAVLEDGPLRRFTLLFSYLVTWQTLLYNYVTLRPGQLAPIPWRDLIPISAYMLPAWLIVVVLAVLAWRRMRRVAVNLTDGNKTDAMNGVPTPG